MVTRGPHLLGSALQPTQFVRHVPSLPLVIGGMSVGVQSDPTELSATQTAAWAVGPRRSGPLVWSIRMIDDSSECIFLRTVSRSTRVRVAVGTRVISRPPHRSVRAAFPHTACMGLSLSRVHHATFVVLCCFILCSTRAASILPSRPHITVAVAHRTALLQRRRRLVLHQREHGGRLPVIGWFTTR